MKVSKLLPEDFRSCTIDIDRRIVHIHHDQIGSISFEAMVMEEVYFPDASHDAYTSMLNILKERYGHDGIVINDCRNNESHINRITVYKAKDVPDSIPGSPTSNIIYHAYHSDMSIFQEIFEVFKNNDVEPTCQQKLVLNTTLSTEGQRVADAFSCDSMQCMSVVNTNNKPVTLGNLRAMLQSCSQHGFTDDTPVYIDDGTTVHPIYDEVHPYRSKCGDKRCVLIIAEEPKPSK